MAKYIYIRGASVRKLAKENGKRCGKDFLNSLDRFVYEKIEHCCRLFNGHRKTLDGSLITLMKGK